MIFGNAFTNLKNNKLYNEALKMWGLIISGITFIVAMTFSLAKASSRREVISIQHREEILARGKEKEENGHKTSDVQKFNQTKVISNKKDLLSSKKK
ncbi:hypothetical protein QWY16_14690 [Planococcus shenhongbingii]|uniref:hypothetical protein n=1 Tax=Planococcus shenhongbingii TaxID=3058398 RepID=UPI00260466D5|nr:hypothetical protein [Planococcus sp. N016]WKA57734.1 hypothetical protein QWY16_14690 [Planococcus sp. N016]